jgi:hypothetical protein
MRSGNATSREGPYDACYPDGFDPSSYDALSARRTGLDAGSPAMLARAGTEWGHGSGHQGPAGDTTQQ